MPGQNLVSQQIKIVLDKNIIDDDYEDECYDFQDELFNFEQILRISWDNWIPKIYSWSKHVKQINELLMAMRNMWWHFRFLFGQTVFLNCLTECQTSCLWFSICLLQWWYWRIKKITEKLLSQELRPVFGVNGLKLCILAISWHLIMILKTLSWRVSFQIFSLIPKHTSTRNLHGPNVLPQPIRNQFSYYYHMVESIFGVDILLKTWFLNDFYMFFALNFLSKNFHVLKNPTDRAK